MFVVTLKSNKMKLINQSTLLIFLWKWKLGTRMNTMIKSSLKNIKNSEKIDVEEESIETPTLGILKAKYIANGGRYIEVTKLRPNPHFNLPILSKVENDTSKEKSLKKKEDLEEELNVNHQSKKSVSKMIKQPEVTAAKKATKDVCGNTQKKQNEAHKLINSPKFHNFSLEAWESIMYDDD